MTSDRQHLASLDVVRGLSVAAMILVNNPGDWNTVFAPFTHTDWNGWTFADVVFPFFVFVMGCAMPFAFARRDARHSGEWRSASRVLRRAGVLVGLGIVLNVVLALPDIAKTRIPGVLQRLGVTYAGAALIVRSAGIPVQAVVAGSLMAGHWAFLTLTPLGGSPAGVLTRDHNLSGVVDTHVFGSHTLMPGFDPEGLLGTATAIATALFGALAGQWLRQNPDRRRQIGGLAAGGIIAIATGLLWSIVWPINKPLWTGSYALLMAGLASCVLALSVYLVDVRGWRRPVIPFLALGANPLAIYFGSELVGHLIERGPKSAIYWNVFAALAGPGECASLLFALAYVGLWSAIAVVLDRHGVRIRV
jgi:predicted acyltransferase